MTVRQLAYECVLEEGPATNAVLLKTLCTPYSAVLAAFKEDKSIPRGSAPSKEVGPSSEEATREDPIPSKSQSKVVLRNLTTSPSRLRKVVADTSKVWPLLHVDVNLLTPLDACFSVLMDTQLVKDYELESTVGYS